MYNTLVREIRTAKTLEQLETIMNKANRLKNDVEFLNVVMLCHYKANELRFC